MNVLDLLGKSVGRVLGKDDLPFKIGEEAGYQSSVWKLYHGIRKSDNSPLSIFICKEKSLFELAKTAVKRLRTIRHPYVLKLIDAVEEEDRVCIATEQVTPLREIGSMSSEMIYWGLYCLLKALEFLNCNCQVVHGSVSLKSIFLTNAGEWRLGNFEFAANEKEFFTQNRYSLSNPDVVLPPECLNRSSFSNYLIADSFALGKMIQSILSMKPSLEYFSNLQRLTTHSLTIQQILQELSRSILKDPFVKMNLALENIVLQEQDEKSNLFDDLLECVDSYPISFCKFKILPESVKALEFAAAGPKALTILFKIGSRLSDSDFVEYITPNFVKLFASTNRQIRVTLCENLHKISDKLSPKVVNEKIFSDLVLGFNDQTPLVREQTLKGVVTILPKISEKHLNELLQYLSRLQTDPIPGIRTNTTVCLGKLSKYLSETSRKKVLIPAFSRALLDPFPAARRASLLAYQVTVEFFDEREISQNIIPVISPLSVDSDSKEIRILALATLDSYIKRLKVLVDQMPITESQKEDTGPKSFQSNPSINKLSSQNKSKESTKIASPLKTDSVHATSIPPNEEAGWDFDFDDEESPVNRVENNSNNLKWSQNNLASNQSELSDSKQNTTSKSINSKPNGWGQWDEEW